MDHFEQEESSADFLKKEKQMQDSPEHLKELGQVEHIENIQDTQADRFEEQHHYQQNRLKTTIYHQSISTYIHEQYYC